ncbi:MAG: GTP 3',8-cyclase MoaA [Candidatus Omnitrophota bacterium]
MPTDNCVSKKIDYLRISLTDRCNLRCSYCMPPEGIASRPHQEIMTLEEIVEFVKIFSSLGVSKVRLTGGEPLVRRGVIGLIKAIKSVKGINEVHLTTNGSLLSFYAEELKGAGINRINISLDTLREDRFKNITKTQYLGDVLRGIDKANEFDITPLKLNMVVMRGVNDDEILDFVEFARQKRLTVRFIEFMKVTPLWREDHFIPIDEVIDVCKRRYKLEKIGSIDSGPAVYYRMEGGGNLGFIKTDTKVCRDCTRLRLTSTGEFKICLYETEGLRLKDLLRGGSSEYEIKEVINKKLLTKRCTNFENYKLPNIFMSRVGG